MSRPLIPQERKWLIEALSTMERGEHFGGGVLVEQKTGAVKPRDRAVDPSFFLNQVDSLLVTSKCECGDPNCLTVYFQHYRGFHTGVVAFHQSGDGHTIIVHTDDGTGEINELEVI
jgi:hypothetical protein